MGVIKKILDRLGRFLGKRDSEKMDKLIQAIEESFEVGTVRREDICLKLEPESHFNSFNPEVGPDGDEM